MFSDQLSSIVNPSDLSNRLDFFIVGRSRDRIVLPASWANASHSYLSPSHTPTCQLLFINRYILSTAGPKSANKYFLMLLFQRKISRYLKLYTHIFMNGIHSCAIQYFKNNIPFLIPHIRNIHNV